MGHEKERQREVAVRTASMKKQHVNSCAFVVSEGGHVPQNKSEEQDMICQYSDENREVQGLIDDQHKTLRATKESQAGSKADSSVESDSMSPSVFAREQILLAMKHASKSPGAVDIHATEFQEAMKVSDMIDIPIMIGQDEVSAGSEVMDLMRIQEQNSQLAKHVSMLQKKLAQVRAIQSGKDVDCLMLSGVDGGDEPFRDVPPEVIASRRKLRIKMRELHTLRNEWWSIKSGSASQHARKSMSRASVAAPGNRASVAATDRARSTLPTTQFQMVRIALS